MGLSRPQKPGNGVSTRWVSLFCIASFFLGVLVVNRSFTYCFISLPSSSCMYMLEDLANLVQNYQAKCLPMDRFGSKVTGFVIPIVGMSV
ncbi:hypothetical protein CRYUN_Cryun07bG0130400 [Craigia yunnanensis]